ncbi:MAG TPA: PhoX family phosphatase [Steroidobacteraceae bacterium]|jgi:secreted PhoX family phosphatase|nr:PhoX family phosphatase [Steroidobacteraceae bacterium]
MNQPVFEAVLAARLSRRALVTGAAATVGLAACARNPTPPSAGVANQSFVSVAPQNSDAFVLADGYRHNVVARWGDSLVTGTADFDTRRLAADDWLDAGAVDTQERQFGTNCDAVAYFSQVSGRASRGLACVNHEYANAELIWPGHRGAGMRMPARKEWFDKHPNAVAFLQAAHGVTVMQLYRDSHGWSRELSARENRRITARTPMDIHGPARGHELMRTRADPTGTRVLGTFANCSAGKTPWGTYLTSEENIDDYFAGAGTLHEASKDAAMLDAYRRFPLRENSFYGWDVQDARFDTRVEPHEPLRFGWMLEIDPHDPKSVPRKRTSLGRFQHEGANTLIGKTGHAVAYMGDDEKFEYIYKFVTRDRFDAKNPAANRDLLDQGTLYCARFDADGTGAWLPLVHDENGPLNSRAGFSSQGDVVIKVRAAADLLGATPMDRPEDVEPSPITGRIYIPCTKSEDRGVAHDDHWNGRETTTGVNAANPRPENKSGHIIEIAEGGDDATATRFEWNVFLLAGDPRTGRYIVDAREVVPGSLASTDTYFGGYPNRADVSPIHCPDNLGIDPQGRLWIVTDTDDHGRANNGCFVVPTSGPQRGLARQLASGPTGCEVCGCEFTPDGRTLFLSIQHPGEGGTLDNPRSDWPDRNGMPARAALLAIEREDGGPV